MVVLGASAERRERGAMTIEECRKNAEQCRKWAMSARDQDNAVAFSELASSWDRAAKLCEWRGDDYGVNRRPRLGG